MQTVRVSSVISERTDFARVIGRAKHEPGRKTQYAQAARRAAAKRAIRTSCSGPMRTAVVCEYSCVTIGQRATRHARTLQFDSNSQ